MKRMIVAWMLVAVSAAAQEAQKTPTAEALDLYTLYFEMGGKDVRIAETLMARN